jgi:2,3-bisphosphoglycerate-independent phosphoglycerate mutase
MTSELKIKPTKPVMLCILDGWGIRSETLNNAIAMGNTPHYDAMMKECPVATLRTSGMDVGLPEGQMGNSEVGHMNLGGGRVIMQNLPRIDKAFKDGEVAEYPEFIASVKALKKSGGTAHILGLLSPGGVHSHQNHIVALAKNYAAQGIKTAIHGFLDGRDVPPKSAGPYIKFMEKELGKIKGASLVTLIGRYFALDRDNRWNRVTRAYDLMLEAKGTRTSDGVKALAHSYDNDEKDEFTSAYVLGDYQGMKDGDGLIMANFRSDRAREILLSFVDPEFEGFKRSRTVKFASQLGMVPFSTQLNQYFDVLFAAPVIQDTLGAVVSQRGLTQLRIAETEKYAHVTFFFNGGAEEIYEGEDRIMVPSPDVSTYDLQPEMAAPEVTEKLIAAIKSLKYDLIIVNFANPDMVGHTGVLSAAIKAVETIDNSLGQLQDALKKARGVMLVTADHGNIETMVNIETGGPHTAHTTNSVPLILVNSKAALQDLPEGYELSLENGALCDMAPSLLYLMGEEKPSAMTGKNLIHIIKRK